MAHASSERGRAERVTRNANQRWKERWRTWVLISTIVGAIGHAIIFIVVPAWEVVARPSPPRLEILQIDPIISLGGDIDIGTEAVAAKVDADEQEVFEEIDAGREGDTEVDLTELIEVFGIPGPSLATPVLPKDRPEDTPPPSPPLILEQVTPLTPRLSGSSLAVQLPIIRNPTVLQRFLRTRYNPIFQEPDGNGHVSVAMWINERGAVEWTAITESSGYPIVDEIALEVFNEIALFTPARSQGVRVPVSMVISVPFTSRW